VYVVSPGRPVEVAGLVELVRTTHASDEVAPVELAMYVQHHPGREIVVSYGERRCGGDRISTTATLTLEEIWTGFESLHAFQLEHFDTVMIP
jgi:hypothetical protein